MVTSLWRTIRNKDFTPITVLFGTESFLLNRTKKLFIEEAIPLEEQAFNLVTIDLEETPIELAIEEMETLPFLGERKLVLLQNAWFLTAERRTDKVEHNLERLLAYVENPAPFTVALFIVPHPKLDERKKVTKRMRKSAQIFEAKPLQGWDLTNWLKDACFHLNLMVDAHVLEELVNLAGNNLAILYSELEKLALFLGGKGEVTTELVAQLVTKSLEQNVFDLVDLIIKKKKTEAVALYHQLLVQKEEPIRILAAITRQYRIFLQVKYLQEQGYGGSQIASKLKINPYPVKLALGQIRRFSEKDLKEKMRQLAEMDYQMKMGFGHKELLLDLFILKS